MAKYNILTDKVNTYFTNNKITIASTKPTTGTWKKGDIVISSSPSSLFGWICTAAGTPGTWSDLNSASELSHSHDNKYYTKNEIDTKFGKYLPLAGGEMTGNVVLNNARSYLYSKTASEVQTTTGTLPLGTNVKLFAYDGSHNFLLGSGIFDNKITTGATYLSGGSNVYLRTNNANGGFIFNINGTNVSTINKDGFNANAATATKLKTARTINGTTFDGTANITTANWGTARSIYISDASASNTGAAVSVNGAGDATLKLPATIKASLAGNASTATALATARTINGTNFDGTTNITTANWGTARTLTIGKTGKSVNGSGNVAWTIDDIGAAPASHTHSYLPLTGGTVTGETIFTQGTRIHAGEGTAGTEGYVNIAQIKISSNYMNQPISIKFAQRGSTSTSNLEIMFAPTSTTDPTLDSFTIAGPGEAYMKKSATSTWQLYIKKSEGYDKIDILDFRKGSYSSGITVTWKNTLVASLPSGNVAAETRAYHKHRLVDLHIIDPDTGQPIGNSSSSPIGTTYVRNSAKEHVGRLSCYHNADTGADYTTVSLYNLANKANDCYLNIYPTYLYGNKAFHSGEDYIQLSGKRLYLKSSSPGAIGAGNVWIKCG